MRVRVRSADDVTDDGGRSLCLSDDAVSRKDTRLLR